jgi:hypothetical protein
VTARAQKRESTAGAAARIAALAIALLAVPLGGAAHGRDCASADAVFPIDSNLGGRYLKDATGRPFLMIGDSPWSLIADLSREDADLYLRDRQSRGFNTLLVNLIEHEFTLDAPANAYGERPFIAEEAFSAMNEAYFDHAAWVLERACELGFLVLLAPAYAGYGGGDHGWYAAMVEAGPDRLRSYGRFVAKRLGGLPNIVWVHGGDYDPPDKELVRAVIAGIDEAAPDAVHTAHGAPETRLLDYWVDEPWLAINTVYTYGHVHAAAAEQFRRTGDRPFIFIEGAYENEFGAGGERVRMQAYQALLSGASGQLFGNNPIWHFDGPGLHPRPSSWQEQLDSPGSRSMSVLAQLFASVEWWRLEPDLGSSLLRYGHGRAASRAVAALADDGSFGLVYIPSQRVIRLDTAGLAGSRVHLAWLDPTTGEVTDLAASPVEKRRFRVRSPGLNSAGDGDWVLMLTADREEAPGMRRGEVSRGATLE